jgi:hypothetical protein
MNLAAMATWQHFATISSTDAQTSSGTCRQTNPYLGEDNWGKFRILLNINSEKTCSEKNSEFFL